MGNEQEHSFSFFALIDTFLFVVVVEIGKTDFETLNSIYIVFFVVITIKISKSCVKLEKLFNAYTHTHKHINFGELCAFFL